MPGQKLFDSFQRVSSVPLPRYTNAHALAANTAETVTIPAWAGAVRVSVTVASYLKEGATATVPGDTTDGTASFLVSPEVPHYFLIRAGQSLSVISAATCIATFSFYEA